jgi:methyl-accepting chemotaxis protein
MTPRKLNVSPSRFCVHFRGPAGQKAAETDARWRLVGGTMGVLAVGVLVALLIGRGLSRPINRMCLAMGRFSAGEMQAVIPGGDRQGEIGSMAKAVVVFKYNMIDEGRLRARQETDRVEAEAQRKRAMMSLADSFDASMRGVVDSVSSSAADMTTAAKSMVTTADDTRRQSLAVSAASEQTSANVQTVATATEELTASIVTVAGSAR